MNNKKLRKDLIKYMYEMGTLKWTPSRDISGKDIGMIYYAGKDYYGPPYSRYNIVMYEDFRSRVKGGIYSVPDFSWKIPAMNCAGPCLCFFSKYQKVPLNFTFADFILNPEYFLPLGPISVTKEEFLNYKLSNYHSEQEFYEGYSDMLVGDYLGFTFREHAMRGPWGHMRLVSGNVHVERDANGKIDGEKSYLFVIEFCRLLSRTYDSNFYGGLVDKNDYVVSYKQNKKQTDIHELSDLKDKTTHFRFNRKLLFRELYTDCYLPFRPRIFVS